MNMPKGFSLIRLCLGFSLGLFTLAGAQDLTEPQNDNLSDRNALIFSCTSNLRATYASPALQGQLIGAEFIDPDMRLQTRQACEDLARFSTDAAHFLWLAYARFADGAQAAAHEALGAIPPPPPGVYGRVDPRIRAADLRRHLMGRPTLDPFDGSVMASLFFEQAPSFEELLRLAQSGLISPGDLVKNLEASDDHLALIRLYRGEVTIDPEGNRLGPDLAALRKQAERMSLSGDPLTSIRGHKEVAAFYSRGFESQGLITDPMRAQTELDQAFNLGLRAWDDIARPEAYREALAQYVLSLIDPILSQSQDGETLALLGDAIARDWAGLSVVHGHQSETAYAPARALGAVYAKAQQIFASLRQGDIDYQTAAQVLNQYAQQDNCVYVFWAQEISENAIEIDRILEAETLFEKAAEAGYAGGYQGLADLHRWGVLDGVPDFARAQSLYTQAVSLLPEGSCNRADDAAIYLNLAWLYFTGQGGQQNLDEARNHFVLSNSYGGFPAAEALSDMYLFGLGVPQDSILAHELAAKAYGWNSLAYQKALLFDFHQANGLETKGLSVGQEGDIPIFSQAEALPHLVRASSEGYFFGTYNLGLATLDKPDIAQDLGLALSGAGLLAELTNHIGAFERGYATTGAIRAAHFDQMRRELSGQVNLAFTSARYDTQAAITHDPRRALDFYLALARSNPTAVKLLTLDRRPYLSAQAQAEFGEGPITLPDIVRQGLEDQLAPLPLNSLLMPYTSSL